ncbi:MAG: DMT family transporter [Syntrophomonas sp.]
MSENNSKYKNYVGLLFLAAILWSTGGVIIKNLSAPAPVIACIRSAAAVILLLIILRRPLKVPSRAALVGAVFYAATVILFVFSNKLTTASNAIILQYTAPLYVLLLGRFWLKEKASISDWIFMFILMGGIVLFFFDDLSGGRLVGNILALLSGVSFGSLTIALRMQKDQTPEDTILLGNIICVLITFPFLFTSRLDAVNITGSVILGVFQLGLPYLLYSIALKKVRAIDGILIPIIEPILNPLWVFLFYGEAPGYWSLVGGTIVLGSSIVRGILISTRPSNK